MNRLELALWRRTRYLTLQDLADLLGVNRQTVHRWETGDATVPSYLHLALAQLDTLHYWSPDGIDALPRIGAVS
jgi:DNA-binding XRE family transcriptional regulator